MDRAFLDFFATSVVKRHVGHSLSRGCLLGDIQLSWIAGGDFLFCVVVLLKFSV